MGTTRPSVLFVCVRNGGTSQMAEALLRAHAGDRVETHSAGTAPGTAVNELSADALAEVRVDMRTGHRPKPIDTHLLARVDRAVVLGREAVVDPAPGMRGRIEHWDTVEPSDRGVDGVARMRLIRDDIATRCRALAGELLD